MNQKPPYRRKKKLIKPRLQLVYSTVFLSAAGIYVLLQSILTQATIARISEELPADAKVLVPALVDGLQQNLVITMTVLVPLTVALGVLVTFRVAGPIYRVETYLKQVIDGEDPGPCRIRKADELQELAALISEATEPIRARHRQAADAAAAEGNLDGAPSLVERSKQRSGVPAGE